MLERLLTLEKTNPILHKKLSADPRKVVASHPKKSRTRKAAAVTGSQGKVKSTAAKPVNKDFIVDLEEFEPEELEPPFNDNNTEDDENIPTATIIAHIVSGGQEQDGYIEQDGRLITATTEADRVDDITEAELEDASDDELAIDSDDNFDPEASKSDKESVESLSLPSIYPTVTQGRSKRVRKATDLNHIHRFWEAA